MAANFGSDITSAELLELHPKIVNKYIATKMASINDEAELAAFKETYLQNPSILEKLSDKTKLYLEISSDIPQTESDCVGHLIKVKDALLASDLFKDSLSARNTALLEIITYDRLAPQRLSKESLLNNQHYRETRESYHLPTLTSDQESAIWNMTNPCVSPKASALEKMYEKERNHDNNQPSAARN